jgi:hypothetical protein
MDTVDSFTGRAIGNFCRSLAEAAVAADVQAVLSPSHFLLTLPSPWLHVDQSLAVELRHSLDKAGGRHIAIYYPLVLDFSKSGAGATSIYLVRALQQLARHSIIDAVSLRLHGFGVRKAGTAAVRKYISIARSLHALAVPILAEKTGTLGLGLMAAGAVGAIESGITFGDTCDLGSCLQASGRSGFSLNSRVYLHRTGGFVSVDVAETLFKKSQLRNWHVCQEHCCNGTAGMLEDPKRHFVYHRRREIADLAAVPPELRYDWYLKDLGSAADAASSAAKVVPELETHAKRLRRWQSAHKEQRSEDRFSRSLTRASAPAGRMGLHRSPTVAAPQEDEGVISIDHYIQP